MKLARFALAATATFASLIPVALHYERKARNVFDHRPLAFGASLIQPDPVIGFWPRPNVRLRPDTPPIHEVCTDALGARIDCAAAAAAPPVVVGLGCSFTWGFGVDYADTFLAQAARAVGVTEYNLAFPSFGLATATLAFDRLPESAPVRVVVYGLINDHLRRSIAPCAPSYAPFCRPVAHLEFNGGRPQIVPPRGSPETHDRYMRDVLADHSFDLRDIAWAFARDIAVARGTDGASLNAVAEKISMADRRSAARSLVANLSARVSSRGATLVVVFIPTPGGNRPLEGVVAEAIRAEPGIRFVDLTSTFADYELRMGQRALWVTATDNHPNATAHRIIAQALAPVVRDALRSESPTDLQPRAGRLSRHSRQMP